MSTMPVLYFEDEAAPAIRFKLLLESAWRQIRNGASGIPACEDIPEQLEICHFSKSEEALRELEKNAGKYPLVVLDLLEKMEGGPPSDPIFHNAGASLAEFLRLKEQKDNLVPAAVLAVTGAHQTPKYAGQGRIMQRVAERPLPGLYGTYA